MKVKSLIIGIILVLLPSLSLFGFCVHNKSSWIAKVIEVKGGGTFTRFKATLKSGETKCCNWKNGGCNKSGKRDAIVKFNVFDNSGNLGCENYSIRADGDLYIINKPHGYWKHAVMISCEGK